MTQNAASARDVGDEDDAARLRRPVGKRWAVLVGISDYADARLKLEFAHRDATAMRDFLLTPAGGAYAIDRIKLLLDRDATRTNVTRALRSFLGETKEDDLALLFFACHGAADARARGQPLYLLTADTDYDDIANTALPMDEIDWSLRQYVRAERVAIVADTCHSAGIQSGARGGDDLSAATLNRYLEQLGASAPGVAYLTSARAQQRSFEDKRWGNGHGAFTHFLLEGLRGAADGHGGRPRDNVVSLAELADYVQKRVYKATGRRQEPILGPGRYDPELPLAVVGGLDVQAKLELARALMEVGWLLDDPAPFLCAEREAAHADRLAGLAGAALAEASAVRGEALLAAQEYDAALRVLEGAHERFGTELPSVARLHLGLALAAGGERQRAAEALDSFCARAPENPEAGWAADYMRWLRRPSGRTRALLIGVGKYESGDISPLLGPSHDVQRLGHLLSDRVGVATEDVITLLDEHATVGNIDAALRHLAECSTDEDIVLVYFSDHANAEADARSPYLITHEARDGHFTGISSNELLDTLALIPASARLLLLDTRGNAVFNAAVGNAGVAAVLAATRPGMLAYESVVGGEPQGAFTEALVAAWGAAEDPRSITWRELCNGIAERLRERGDQVPALAGPPDSGIFQGEFPAAQLWRTSRTRSGPAPSASLIRAAEAGGWPRGRLLAGRAASGRRRTHWAAGAIDAAATELGEPWGLIDAARVARRW